MSKIKISKFKIVTSPYPQITESNFANELQQYLAENGHRIDIVSDIQPPAENEIFVGFSDRARLHPNGHNFEVAVRGTKIYMVAGDMFGYDAMRTYVRETFWPAGQTIEIDTEAEPFSYKGDGNDLATNILLERGDDVRVMFYNILGGKCPLRKEMQLELFRIYRPDVIGLQEYHPCNRYNGFKDKTEGLGYREVKIDDALLSEHGGHKINMTPLFYRYDRLELLDFGYRLFGGKNDACSKGVTWGLFRVRTTGKKFFAASTHYWWEYREPVDMEIRINNSKEALDIINTLQAKPEYANIPFLFGGDLNCYYESDPIRTLLNDGMDSAFDLAERKKDECAHHSYSTLNETHNCMTKWPAVPTKPYKTGAAIDHAFVKGTLKVKKFSYITDRYAMMASDHSPLVIDIEP